MDELELDQDTIFEEAEAAPTQERQFAVPLRVIDASEMPLVVGQIRDTNGNIVQEGTTYYIQEGRTIEVLPAMSFGTIFSTAGLLMHAKGQDPQKMIRSMGDLAANLSRSIARWDLVDLGGEPLPQPYKNPEAVMLLTEDQLAWLVTALTSRETPEARGKGSRPLPSTTRARTSRPRRSR